MTDNPLIRSTWNSIRNYGSLSVAILTKTSEKPRITTKVDTNAPSKYLRLKEDPP